MVDWLTDKLTAKLGNDRVLTERSDILPYCYEFVRYPSDDSITWPACVVLPETTEEVSEIVKLAIESKTPITTRGGGSSFVEAIIPSEGSIVLSTARMNRVCEIDPINMTVTAQPGVNLADMDRILEPHGLILAQEQGSYKTANIGGAVSTYGLSASNYRYGDIGDNVLSLEAVLGDGRVMRTGPRVYSNSSGYHLHKLFTAAEGTLGIITELTLQLMPKPEFEDAIGADFDSWATVKEVALKILSSGVNRCGGDVTATREEDGKWRYPVVIGLEGKREEVEAQKREFARLFKQYGGKLMEPEEAWELWKITRKKWCGISHIDIHGNSLTAALPLEHYDAVYRIVEEDIYPKYKLRPYLVDYKYIVLGRRPLIGFEFQYNPDEVSHDQMKKALGEIAEVVARYGGSGPACHGVGALLRDQLIHQYDPVALDMMRGLKRVFDPFNILNPGIKIPE